ncbi:MAG TPA: Dabb family protein [Gemmatimonadales bacterium]|nr:Dabb family protein [Gemmatimonadales bacterium]
MIHHVVCLRFKPGTPESAIEEAGRALVGMERGIPEIRGLRWGPNLATGTVGEYSHVLVVMVDDLAAVDRYLAHPVHQATVARHVAPIREARLALDIEV